MSLELRKVGEATVLGVVVGVTLSFGYTEERLVTHGIIAMACAVVFLVLLRLVARGRVSRALAVSLALPLAFGASAAISVTQAGDLRLHASLAFQATLYLLLGAICGYWFWGIDRSLKRISSRWVAFCFVLFNLWAVSQGGGFSDSGRLEGISANATVFGFGALVCAIFVYVYETRLFLKFILIGILVILALMAKAYSVTLMFVVTGATLIVLEMDTPVKKAVGVAALVVGVFATGVYVNVFMGDRLEELNSLVSGELEPGPNGSFQRRYALFVEAYRIFLENPWAGVGFGNVELHMDPAIRPATAHNAYIDMLAGAGLVGGAWMVLALAAAVKAVMSVNRRKYEPVRDDVLFGLTGAIGVLVFLGFFTGHYRVTTMFSAGMFFFFLVNTIYFTKGVVRKNCKMVRLKRVTLR